MGRKELEEKRRREKDKGGRRQNEDIYKEREKERAGRDN